MVLAAVVAVAGTILGDPSVWLARSLVVLVAAAPCAFAISVPVTVVAAVGAASRHGVLVKGGAALEALGTVHAVALDKTGTLTRNHPQVVGVVVAPGSTREEVLGIAAALEARSEHPLAEAILSEVGPLDPADDISAVPGQGVEGILRGRPARLGKPGFVDPGSLDAETVRLQAAGPPWSSSSSMAACSAPSLCATSSVPRPLKPWSPWGTLASPPWRCSPATTAEPRWP
jgi:cation-transporting ATPase G